MIKRVLFNIVVWLSKIFVGKGLGRIPLLKKAYAMVSKSVAPAKPIIIPVKTFKLLVNVNSHGLDGMAMKLMLDHEYEPVTTKAFEYIVHKGMNVVDIGANLGYYTILSSKLVGDDGTVWAVEPEPSNYDCLLNNILINGCIKNVAPYRKAIHSQSGKAPLYVSDNESGEHSLVLVEGRSYIDNTIQVEAITLDELMDGQKVDVVKLDAEGNEVNVLIGGKDVFMKNQDIKLITEFWISGIIASGYTPEEYWQFLEYLDFKHIYILDEIGKEIWFGTLNRALACCKDGKYSVNLLCSRRELDIWKL